MDQQYSSSNIEANGWRNLLTLHRLFTVLTRRQRTKRSHDDLGLTHSVDSYPVGKLYEPVSRRTCPTGFKIFFAILFRAGIPRLQSSPCNGQSQCGEDLRGVLAVV
jgi:hypothetical protein